MKIGVVGTCTAPGIGMGLRQLLEDDEIVAFEAIAVRRENGLQKVADILSGCEVLFSHYLTDDYGPLSTSALKLRHRDVRMMPGIAFTGFHPDCVVVIKDGKKYHSPLGDYNSAIAAAAFTMGQSVKATRDLFRLDIYRALGYFEEFGKAHTFLKRLMDSLSLDFDAEWNSWMARAPFMHTINHPKPFVVGSIAKMIAVKAALIPPNTPVPEMLIDTLGLGPMWPLYPGLAEEFGRKGSFLFKKAGQPDFAKEGSFPLLNLDEFLDGSFARYADYIPEAFSANSVTRVRKVLETLV